MQRKNNARSNPSYRSKRSQNYGVTRTDRQPNIPPRLNTSIEVRHVFRFTPASAGTSTITSQNIMGLLFTGTSVATTNVSLFSAFRLNRISMWAPGGGSNNLGIEYQNITAGAVGARPTSEDATSTSTSQSLKISKSPPPNTTSATWQNVLTSTTTNTGVNVIIIYTASTTIDFDISFVLNNGEVPFLAAKSQTGSPVVGQIYAQYLDGATGQLKPVGYSSF